MRRAGWRATDPRSDRRPAERRKATRPVAPQCLTGRGEAGLQKKTMLRAKQLPSNNIKSHARRKVEHFSFGSSECCDGAGVVVVVADWVVFIPGASIKSVSASTSPRPAAATPSAPTPAASPMPSASPSAGTMRGRTRSGARHRLCTTNRGRRHTSSCDTSSTAPSLVSAPTRPSASVSGSTAGRASAAAPDRAATCAASSGGRSGMWAGSQADEAEEAVLVLVLAEGG